MEDACQCEYCLNPNPFYRQTTTNAQVVGNGTFSYPIRIRMRLGNENVNAILMDETYRIRFRDGHRVKGFSAATTHVHTILGQRQTRKQGENELHRWCINIEGVGSVPLSLIKMSHYFVNDPGAVPIPSFCHECLDMTKIETKSSLSENPLFANSKCGKLFYGNVFFRQPPSMPTVSDARRGAKRSTPTVSRGAKRSRNVESSAVCENEEDEDCTPICEWDINSPPGEWNSKNIQDFLLAFRTRAPILLGIDGVIPPPVEGVGNPLMRVRIQHTGTGQAIPLILSSALLYTVPQYRAQVDAARWRVDL